MDRLTYESTQRARPILDVDSIITYHRVFSANDRRGARKYLYVEPDLILHDVEGKRTIPGTSSESRLGRLTASGHIHKVTITANVVKGLPFQNYKCEMILDEETTVRQPHEIYMMRVVKLNGLMYPGGHLNFFVALSATGLADNEYRRIGLAIWEVPENKRDRQDVVAKKQKAQTDMDQAITNTQTVRFTIV